MLLVGRKGSDFALFLSYDFIINGHGEELNAGTEEREYTEMVERLPVQG